MSRATGGAENLAPESDPGLKIELRLLHQGC